MTRSRESLTETWEALGIDPEELEYRGDTVVAPTRVEPPELPKLVQSSGSLELGEVLGEGGMGLVRAATQTALLRTVAVKTARAGSKQGEQLIREGRVTGLLEHPNIVPVYALGQDDEGRPLIVMKRIEGKPWTTLLGEASEEERVSGPFLRRHLRILQQVAAAVHFAHSRGVLHRDIKPDNVMIGSFGEVYLVDWGVAVSTLDEPLAGVPRAKDVKCIEGTPVYMAPEMSAATGEKLGVESDVYLLGATLHHVLTGGPPHVAGNIHTILLNAYVSAPPVYSAQVPPELAVIAQTAMARDVDRRYRSARAFSEAVESFLVHRDAFELCHEAERRFEELEQLEASDHEKAEALFNEARFAFEQSLRSWPDNERARRGRRRLIIAMTELELRRGAPRLAEALLRLDDDPPAELLERVLRSVEQDAQKTDRLAALEHDVDLRFGVDDRVRRAYLGAVTWAVALFTCGALTRHGIYEVGHLEFAAMGVVFLLGAMASAWTARKTMLANATNRRVTYISISIFAYGTVLWPLLGLVGVSMPHSTVVGASVAAVLWSMMPGSLSRAWRPMVLGHVGIAIAAWFLPRWHFELYGLVAIPIVWTARRMKSFAME